MARYRDASIRARDGQHNMLEFAEYFVNDFENIAMVCCKSMSKWDTGFRIVFSARK